MEQKSPALAVDMPPALALAVQAVLAASEVFEAQVFYSFCMSRRVVGYNDCTWFHLPGLNWKPVLPKNDEAMFAILAARMAFSSLVIRSRLK